MNLSRNFKTAVSTINNVTKALSKKYRDKKVILFLDEVQPCKYHEEINFDMSDLDISYANIDLLMAINPQDTLSKGKFNINPPKAIFTLTKQLIHRHRNSYVNGIFLEHYKSITETFRGILNPFYDKSLDPNLLPSGRLPIWIQRSPQVPDRQILDLIKREYMSDKEHATILTYKESEEIAQWCDQNGCRYIGDKYPWGIEDQVVVIFNSSPGPEALSRARNCLIMVTIKG